MPARTRADLVPEDASLVCDGDENNIFEVRRGQEPEAKEAVAKEVG